MNKLLLDIAEEITTKRLVLQVAKGGYGELLYEALDDGYEDLVKWLGWSRILLDPEELEICCRRMYAKFILCEKFVFLIIDRSTNKVIGFCGLPTCQVIWNIPQFGISYFIKNSERGKGYATEAVKALVDLVFRQLKAKKIEIRCDVRNVNAQRVPEKLDFELECVIKGGWPSMDGELASYNCYSLFPKNLF